MQETRYVRSKGTDFKGNNNGRYKRWRHGSQWQTLLPRDIYYTEWPKKMYTLFTHQYLWNKFKWNFYFRV